MFKKVMIALLAAVTITAFSVGAYNMISARAAANGGETAAVAAAGAVTDLGATDSTAPLADPQVRSLGENTTASGPAWQNSVAQPEANTTGQQVAGTQGRGGQGNPNAGNGNRGSGNGARGQNQASNVPSPENGLQEWVTFSGQVSNFSENYFTLLTADGQQIPVQLGSLNYIASLNLALQEGDAVTVVGFWETVDTFTAGAITLDATGEVINLRDEIGRPLWAGGGSNR